MTIELSADHYWLVPTCVTFFRRSLLINTGVTLAVKIMYHILLSNLLIELRMKPSLLWLKHNLPDKVPRVKLTVKTHMAGVHVCCECSQRAFVFMLCVSFSYKAKPMCISFFYVKQPVLCCTSPRVSLIGHVRTVRIRNRKASYSPSRQPSGKWHHRVHCWPDGHEGRALSLPTDIKDRKILQLPIQKWWVSGWRLRRENVINSALFGWSAW